MAFTSYTFENTKKLASAAILDAPVGYLVTLSAAANNAATQNITGKFI